MQMTFNFVATVSSIWLIQKTSYKPLWLMGFRPTANTGGCGKFRLL